MMKIAESLVAVYIYISTFYKQNIKREEEACNKTFSFSEIFCKGGFSRLGGDIR